MNTEQNKAKLLNRLANNLGLDSIKSGSYLHTLADGLYSVTEEVLAEINTDILNLNIDTADEETLDVLGVNLGAPRIKDRFLNFVKESKDAKIQVTLYKNDDSIRIPLYSRGQVLDGGPIQITLTDDVIYDSSIPEDNYISCVLQVSNDTFSSDIRVGSNHTISLPNPNPELIKEVNFISRKERTFIETPETLSAYRKRLLALTQSQNISGEDVVRKILASNGVHKYFIERENGVHTIYCLIKDMYEDFNLEEEFISNTLPVIKHFLEESKPFGSYIDLKTAKPVNIIIDIKTSSDLISTQMIYDFLKKVQNEHTLGSLFRIDPNNLTEVLEREGVEAEFELSTIVDFNGYRELIEDLVLEENEYPRFLSVNVYNPNEGD